MKDGTFTSYQKNKPRDKNSSMGKKVWGGILDG